MATASWRGAPQSAITNVALVFLRILRRIAPLGSLRVGL
jgi:hypothetical protein